MPADDGPGEIEVRLQSIETRLQNIENQLPIIDAHAAEIKNNFGDYVSSYLNSPEGIAFIKTFFGGHQEEFFNGIVRNQVTGNLAGWVKDIATQVLSSRGTTG